MRAHLDLLHQPNLTRLLLFRKLNVLAIDVISPFFPPSLEMLGMGPDWATLEKSYMCISQCRII